MYCSTCDELFSQKKKKQNKISRMYKSYKGKVKIYYAEKKKISWHRLMVMMKVVAMMLKVKMVVDDNDYAHDDDEDDSNDDDLMSR